ncbi:MAG: PQQ-like beta-propeller repeat protein [Sedimentisphaerales bacterium]|nr:PQQ-like beta-propeller repeat protein [Sedimentisphaerales bacterium]
MRCLKNQGLVILLALTLWGGASGADWAQWRGPSFDGSTNEKDLPASWSASENTVWVSLLPGPSGATAIISNGRVFVSSTVKGTDDFVAMCFDERSGKELWRKQIGSDSRRYMRNNPCSPSPVADGKNVYFLYGSGHLVGFDFDGNELWSRNIEAEYGNLALMFGYSNSPLLYDGRLYVLAIRRDSAYRQPHSTEPLDSFIAALDPKTGKTIWKQQRKTNAFDEGMEAYGTTIPFLRNGKVELLNTGADFVTAHDPVSGEELWRFEYWTRKVRDSRIIPSLVTGRGLIFGTLHKHKGVFALKPPAGDDPGKILWEFDYAAPDASTPLFYDGRLYVLDGITRGKVVTCFEPETGKQLWQGKLGGRGPWRASLTAGDGKMYCICETGEVVVLKAGGENFEILFETKYDEGPIQASIAIANRRLFIRTAENLYCVGK